MQQFTIKVPENKIDAFMQSVHLLGLSPILEKTMQDFALNALQIKQLEDASRKIETHPDEFMDWDEAYKKLMSD